MATKDETSLSEKVKVLLDRSRVKYTIKVTYHLQSFELS